MFALKIFLFFLVALKVVLFVLFAPKIFLFVLFAPSQSGTKVRLEPPCFCAATPGQRRLTIDLHFPTQSEMRHFHKKQLVNLLCPLPLAASYVVGDERAVREGADELLALKVPADWGEPALGAPVVLLLLLGAQVPEGEKARLETNQKLGRVGRIFWGKTRWKMQFYLGFRIIFFPSNIWDSEIDEENRLDNAMTCCIHPGQRARHTRNTKDWQKDAAQVLTQQVGDRAWVGRLMHPDCLVPVDDVAGQAEVVQVEDVRVPLLRPHKEPLWLDGCRHCGETLSVEVELLQHLHRAFLDLPRSISTLLKRGSSHLPQVDGVIAAEGEQLACVGQPQQLDHHAG